MSDKQKQFVINNIIKTSNSDKRLSIMMSASKNIIRIKYNDLSDNDFEKIWDKFGPEWYLSNLKKLYCQHFTLEDLNGILAFWLSKAGQKLVRGEFAESEARLGLSWSLELESACKKLRQEGNHEIQFG